MPITAAPQYALKHNGKYITDFSIILPSGLTVNCANNGTSAVIDLVTLFNQVNEDSPGFRSRIMYSIDYAATSAQTTTEKGEAIGFAFELAAFCPGKHFEVWELETQKQIMGIHFPI